MPIYFLVTVLRTTRCGDAVSYTMLLPVFIVRGIVEVVVLVVVVGADRLLFVDFCVVPSARTLVVVVITSWLPSAWQTVWVLVNMETTSSSAPPIVEDGTIMLAFDLGDF